MPTFRSVFWPTYMIILAVMAFVSLSTNATWTGYSAVMCVNIGIAAIYAAIIAWPIHAFRQWRWRRQQPAQNLAPPPQ